MSSKLSRRVFLQSASFGVSVLAMPWFSRMAMAGWDEVPAILARIRPPVFPNRDFDITKYGAVGDGTKDCSKAIQEAIAACSQAGGGRVLVPAGVFLTGPIHLRSKVNLHVSEGATLRFITDPSRYLPAVYTRWEGVEGMNYSPFIYAFDQKDVAVTGAGTLDGQANAENWWWWNGSPFYGGGREKPNQMTARARLFKMGDTDVPVKDRIIGDGGYLRPNFVQFYHCQNVLIDGVTVKNSPMWQIHPVLCTNVTVRGVTMASHGPNNDGCNPESSRDVLIENCFFDTGDDCIAIKSGRNRDGRRVGVPSENIIIRNCRMKNGHGGVTIGSEASGGVRNVFAENCQMDSPELDRALRLKTNSVRGGFIENVFMRNVTVGQVADAMLSINLLYEEGDTGQFPPVIRNIETINVTSKKSKYALYLKGYKQAPLRDIRLTKCSFENVAQADVVENVEGLVLDHVMVNGQLRP
jgi:polygalacturonase